jgi:hypothetical protein
MNAGFDRHYPERIWEAYSMGMLSEKDSRPLEEHLLLCPLCQDLLAEADEYIRVAKAALSRPRKGFSKPMAAAVALATALVFFRVP